MLFHFINQSIAGAQTVLIVSISSPKMDAVLEKGRFPMKYRANQAPSQRAIRNVQVIRERFQPVKDEENWYAPLTVC